MAWIEKRGAKYKVYWDVGTPEDRKRRSESFDTSEEATQFKKKIEYEASIGLCFDPTKMTFGEYLDHWLKIHSVKLAPKTIASYKCEIDNHMKPHMGSIKLTKLSPMHLQNYYSSLLSDGKAAILRRKIESLKNLDRPDKRSIKHAEKRLKQMETASAGGLSPTTVAYHHRIIHKALMQAMKWGMVARNVADAVDPPQKEKPQIEYMKKDQVNQFVTAIKESQDYPVIAAAIFTGMRQGELLGLRWKDVDLDNGILHIEQQLQYLPARGYFFKEPKQNSKRSIPIPLPLNAVFRAVKKDQGRLRLILNDQIYNPHDLVFCTPEGRPMDGSALTKRFQNLLIKNGFPKIRFHSLRHTFATMCRAAGTNLEDVQDLLGHADMSTTKNMYTHIEIEPLRRAMDKFASYISS